MHRGPRRRSSFALLVLLTAAPAIVAACGGAKAPAPEAPVAPEASAAIAPAASPSSAEAPIASASPSSAPSNPPAAVASGPGPSTPGPAPKPESAAPPRAGVKKGPGGPRAYNIGMHIGGGPHDDFTKEPIKKSVAPHHAAMAQCMTKLEPPKALDFGVDLLVPGEGGKALEVSHARSTVKGDAFVSCVVELFKTVDFQKPRNGRTKVSYSMRFEP